MSFIFQTRHPQAIKSSGIISWVASKYRDQMKQGSVVYFWVAHRDPLQRGIYGWGVIGDEPRKSEIEGIYRVKVEHRCSFLESNLRRHIPVEEIRLNPVLQNLTILRMAIGTNFLLTDEEDKAIREIIARDYGVNWLPPPLPPP